MKKYLPKIYLLLSSTVAVLHVGAQQTVTGFLVDTTGASIPYATVVLTAPDDSTLVKGAVTDEQGSFLFENIAMGTYRVSASKIGYETLWSASFEVTADNLNPLPHFVLTDAARKLEEVTVVAERPLYEKQVDRTVINVQANVVNKSSSVLEVLARSPGVAVSKQTGTIRMFGKSGVQVMINGRVNRMPLIDLVNMLDGMNAANVEKIELITAPPSRYEAEGTAGILNIVMVESPDRGTHGTLGAMRTIPMRCRTD